MEDFDAELDIEAEMMQQQGAPQEQEEEGPPEPAQAPAAAGAGAAAPLAPTRAPKRVREASDDDASDAASEGGSVEIEMDGEEDEGDEEEDDEDEDDEDDDEDDESLWEGVSTRGDNDEEEEGQSAVGGGPSMATSAHSSGERLKQTLDHMPGWAVHIHGKGKIPRAPVFSTGNSGSWLPWDEHGPFAPGVKICPVRTLSLFVHLDFMAKGARTLGEWETLSDPTARARSVATAALMGMMTIGTAKGWLCSDNHCELRSPAAADMDEDEYSKHKKKLHGMLKTYTWNPNRNGGNDAADVAMQYTWVFELAYDANETLVGFWVRMLIYDPSFSPDEHWSLIMNENNELSRHGLINSVPEALRNSRMERQNKLQRAQIDDNNMETTACTQYKRIRSPSDLIKMYQSYGGASDGNPGRPLYADIKRDTPPGCETKPLARHPSLGGLHPLGPSVALNDLRYLEPGKLSPTHPGVNVSIAGTVDTKGVPINIHPEQRYPANRYDAQGNYEPSEWAKQKRAVYICHDPNNSCNLFRMHLPVPLHGGVTPDRCLLEIYWDTYKDTNPVLKKAQEQGKTTLDANYDAVVALFHKSTDSADPEQEKLSTAVFETDMLGTDSLDQSLGEAERIEHRSYGKRTSEKQGNLVIMEPQQRLKDISIEQVKTHEMIDSWDKRKRAKISADDYDARNAAPQPPAPEPAAAGSSDAPPPTPPAARAYANTAQAIANRRVKHEAAVSACIRLGLQRFQSAYERKRDRRTIPPGWYDVAYTGLRDALREAGEIGAKRAAVGLGRVVDPDDSNAGLGTANIGFAHKQNLISRDVTPFGHWRAFLMELLSSGVKISGGDVKIMLECWIHAFEPFQEVSFFFLMCGGPGAGKSMRAKRLQQLLCDGWVKNSGSASKMAGMNGGMDFLCGRLVYYDEITNDFGSNDSERIEYLKSITMENCVSNTRTVKVMGEGGAESFTTVVLTSLHYESHLMATNCGPLGLKADVEPGTNRAALSDRSWAHITHAAPEDEEGAEVDFDVKNVSVDVRAQINKLRVLSCLTAYTLIFTKHIPQCQPNLTYANMLSNEWDNILCREYNLPKPSKRKKIKRRMMFHLFAAESATFEKFALPEASVSYQDMLPDANGNLSPFCIEQLVDVVRSLQRCLDHEAILTAWSHSLDHSPATSAHVFQMKTVLSQLHGCDLDRRTLVGEIPDEPSKKKQKQAAEAGAGAQGPQGKANESDQFDEEAERIERMCAEAEELAAQQAEQPADEPAAPPVATGYLVQNPPPPGAPTVTAELPPTSGAGGAGAAAASPNGPLSRGANEGDEIVPPKRPSGESTNTTCYTKGVMQTGLTRRGASQLARELEVQRICRAEMSNRALVKKVDVGDGTSASKPLEKLFTDGKDRNGNAMHKMGSTGQVIGAKRAAGACMPNASDAMALGVSEQFLKEVLSGNSAKVSDTVGTHCQKLGIKPVGWHYEVIGDEDGMRGPASYDFNWAQLDGFKKASEAAGGGGGGGDSKRIKSTWTNAAKVIKSATKNSRGGKRTFSMIERNSMTFESMRDTIFLIAQPQPENKIRIPQYNHSRRATIGKASEMRSQNQELKSDAPPEFVHPVGMFKTTADTVGVDALVDDFKKPAGLERPVGSTVAVSDYQKRLDTLTEKRALPTCIAPDSFEKGVPIKESEATNGIFFNKNTASEHSNLVLEMGSYLADVPGVAGGDYTAVPPSFRHPDAGAGDAKKQAEELLQECQHLAKQEALLASGRETPSDGEGSEGPELAEVREDPMEQANREAEAEAQRLEDASEDEDDEDEGYASEDMADAPPLQGDAPYRGTSPDLLPMESAVRDPAGEGTGIEAGPGAAQASAAASVDPDTPVKALPFHWDMSGMFFTCKMASTLHNDVGDYVDKFRGKFDDVFGNETRAETLRDLPQLSLRFPATHEGDKKLVPLTRPVPLTQSRVSDIARKATGTSVSRELTRLAHSYAQGRSISYNDPVVAEQEAEARGIDSGFVLEGNLFARSTWQRFTLSALDARGMLSKEELHRVNDQGLGLALRVRNARAATNHPQANPHLKGGPKAQLGSFEAQERHKRLRETTGVLDEEDVADQSEPAKRKRLENERKREELNSAMDCDPEI